MRFQSKDIQSFISYNVWLFFVLSGSDLWMWTPLYGIHIQIIMLIMANSIENESKNHVQINKMAIEEKT